METELLTVDDLCRRLAVGKRTAWRWTEAGLLPQPLRLGPNGRCVRWRKADVEQFLASPQQLPRRRARRAASTR